MTSQNRPLWRLVWRSRGVRWGALSVVLNLALMLTMFEIITSQAIGLLSRSIDRSVREQLSLLAARPPDLLPFMITSRMQGGAAVVTEVGLFRADRTPIVGSLTEWPRDLKPDGRAHSATAVDGLPLRAAGQALPDGRLLAVARDATDLIEIEGDLSRAALALALPFSLITLGIGALLGVLSDRRLRQMNETAERIIGGDLSLRLPADPDGDELSRLGVIVNRMLRRMQEAVTALRNAGENIAHDLRTPLTSVRARLERAAGQAGEGSDVGRLIERSIVGIDQTLGTITALLRIADIEQGRRRAAFSTFSPRALLAETAEIFAPVAEDRGLSLLTDLRCEGEILADRDMMCEAVANLVDNALKFTPPGGRVVVACRDEPEGLVISVADTGPGIPAAMRQAVLTRFVQLDSSRKTEGRGLGLSLVHAICELHGFRLEVAGGTEGAVLSIICRNSV